MSELLNQTVADIERLIKDNNGIVPESHHLSESDWHKLRSEIALQCGGRVPVDDDYPLLNFYIGGINIHICIRAPIMEEDDGA